MSRSLVPALRRLAAILTLLVALSPVTTWAQTAAPADAGTPAPAQAFDLVRVFLDCEHECDTEYLRQNVVFIDYVRDRAAADVHVLVTTQGTGGGGQSWTLAFIGSGRFQGQNRTLTFSTPQTASADDRRREFARVFKLGLAGYAATTSAAARMDVSFDRPADQAQATPAKDRWNFWVFRVNANGSTDGEQSRKSRSFEVSFSANRTTEKWKLSFSGGRDTNRSTFELENEETGEDREIVSRRHSWTVNGLIVRSLGPHWSVGLQARPSHSSFSNTDRAFYIAPGIEYDLFPYSESSRRSLTFRYMIGAIHNRYREVTIFDKMRETVPNHQVEVGLGLRQPWGSVSAEATFKQHLNDRRRYRTGFFGSTDVNLFKGFSFNIFGSYNRIRDQIELPKTGISTEDVLLRIRQLQTGYSYFIHFGVSYSFGSIFNSIVNPRFSGVGF